MDTNISLALLGYDFLCKNKVDILTSANCLLIKNVPIITHMHNSRKTVGVILTANSTIEPYSENILEGQTEEQEAQLLSKDSCILKPEISIEDRLRVLIARGLVTPAKMPIRVLNVSNRFVNLKAEISWRLASYRTYRATAVSQNGDWRTKQANYIRNYKQLYERRSLNANSQRKR